ncbi:MAG: lipid-A-disaccharide synthase [Rikenellaceae bacterium]
MKYYIIAGEASGDIHAANLMRGIIDKDSKAEFRFWGGDNMALVGGKDNLVKHYKETSFMGFVEVAKNLKTILSQMSLCKKDLLAYAPDVLIMVDYPGFNLAMAKFAKSKNIKTFYYISPKVWAWKENRVKALRKYVDKLFVIFPFEVEYFKKHNIDVVFEGNPSVDYIEQRLSKIDTEQAFRAQWSLGEAPLIALLAGSRKTEIANSLPFMVELSQRFPEYQFVVAAVPWLEKSLYDKYLAGSSVKCVEDRTFELLKYSNAAIVTSGTATLETALVNTPEIVCYRADKLSAWIARNVIKIRFVSLVNIIMNREIVRELLQQDMTTDNAEIELKNILEGGSKREQILKDYQILSEMMGSSGASKRVASKMIELM